MLKTEGELGRVDGGRAFAVFQLLLGGIGKIPVEGGIGNEVFGINFGAVDVQLGDALLFPLPYEVLNFYDTQEGISVVVGHNNPSFLLSLYPSSLILLQRYRHKELPPNKTTGSRGEGLLGRVVGEFAAGICCGNLLWESVWKVCFGESIWGVCLVGVVLCDFDAGLAWADFCCEVPCFFRFHERFRITTMREGVFLWL